ncbi:MAG: FAD-binding oxidoreductase [Oligoflexia bacterium]|nr:FAD-binding oxidoreductase [Oligoflexia bacterium]
MSYGESWGRYPKTNSTLHPVQWLHEPIKFESDKRYLPYGQGRSYGDCCLNDAGVLLTTNGLSRIISFDRQTGVLRCEAGLTIDEVLRVIVPAGWFVPVTPGTRFVSIGGAIANDVHGKNHHTSGTFGRHVLAFELLRSSGERLLCSPQQNTELFRASIAGLGLTGLITWAEIQLKPIKNAGIEMESVRFSDLEEFFQISGGSEKDFEYTVAWLDCVSSGSAFGRGIFMRGNHSAADAKQCRASRLKLAVPVDAPGFALNRWTVQAFNSCYYNKQRQKSVRSLVHYEPFFYPLDAVLDWNRIYGRRGFFQFQCVLPPTAGKTALSDMLREIVASGNGSFLAVLKEFGDLPSPGMMSFPRPGVTLCLDFANHGEKTACMMKRLDAMTREFGGAMYPAKDAWMTADNFRRYFPCWQEFSKFIDPAFSSSFWRRVSA